MLLSDTYLFMSSVQVSYLASKLVSKEKLRNLVTRLRFWMERENQKTAPFSKMAHYPLIISYQDYRYPENTSAYKRLQFE